MVLLITLLAAATVKTVVLAQLHDHPLLQPTGGLDSEVYAALARRAADGDWALGPEPYFVAPLYVYFLALVLRLTGSLLAAQVLQVVLGVAAIALVFDAARRLYGRSAAAAAAVLAAATGVLTFNEVLLLQSSLDPFLAALGLALLASALETGRLSGFVLAGFAVGVHALNRPNILLWLPVLALLVAIVQHRPKAALAVLAGALVAIAPVTLRNRAVSGEWIPISSHGGLNFYIGNNERADGTYRSVPGVTPSIAGQAEDARRVAEAAVGRPLGASETSQYFSGLAWEWIRGHPGKAAALLLRKLAYTFNATELSLNYSYGYYRDDERTALRLLPVGAWLLVPLGLLGLVAAPTALAPRLAWTWKAFVPVYAASVAAFFVAGRYRLPLLVALCVTAGGAAAHLAGLARRTDKRALAAASVSLAVLGIVASWDFGLDDGRANEAREMARAHVERGRIEQTRAAAEREARGVALFQRGELEPAARELEAACALDPTLASAQLNLAVVRAEQGRYAEARDRVDEALRLRPDYPQARGLRAALDGVTATEREAKRGPR
jgi:4-amino-4-deoxy-L-arabinose transferase-like glycosyltransferase